MYKRHLLSGTVGPENPASQMLEPSPMHPETWESLCLRPMGAAVVFLFAVSAK